MSSVKFNAISSIIFNTLSTGSGAPRTVGTSRSIVPLKWGSSLVSNPPKQTDRNRKSYTPSVCKFSTIHCMLVATDPSARSESAISVASFILYQTSAPSGRYCNSNESKCVWFKSYSFTVIYVVSPVIVFITQLLPKL